MSGVVAGAWSGATLDDEGLRAAIREAFEEAGRTLEAAGSSYADVVDIISFPRLGQPLLRWRQSEPASGRRGRETGVYGGAGSGLDRGGYDGARA